MDDRSSLSGSQRGLSVESQTYRRYAFQAASSAGNQDAVSTPPPSLGLSSSEVNIVGTSKRSQS